MSLFDVYPLYDITPIKAGGMYVYDDTGKKYLDLYGGHAVISIGHNHSTYVNKLKSQIETIGFYSNAIKNPLQVELAEKITRISGCSDYQLFLCNSGAEANENALKLASFVTGKQKILAFKGSFHGRTSAAVAATDNPNIVAPINAQHQVDFIELGNIDAAKSILEKGETAAVIVEFIQGVGGLDESSTYFFKALEDVCKATNTLLIADEVQAGYGRTGDFFAFQMHGITPDIISMAKGMGNGFPIGGILIHPDIKPAHGLLGTTFGGNHLACAAGIAVLDTIEREGLLNHVKEVSNYFVKQLKTIKGINVIKGRGLMLGVEFPFPVAGLRKQLLFDQHIFTGGSSNPNLIRILPPLTIQKGHIDTFIGALKQTLKTSAV